jgi:hypothetical protein
MKTFGLVLFVSVLQLFSDAASANTELPFELSHCSKHSKDPKCWEQCQSALGCGHNPEPLELLMNVVCVDTSSVYQDTDGRIHCKAIREN